MCLRRFAPPTCTSSGFSASSASGSGLPATMRWLPEWAFSARTVVTTTAASGAQPGDPALDVEEPLGAHVGAEAGLGDQEVTGVDADQVGHDRGVAVRDVAERARVDEHGRVLQRLQQVRPDRVLHDHGHRAGGLQLLGGDRLARRACSRPRSGRAWPACRAATIDRASTAIDLGRGGDVEAGLPRHAVRRGAEADHDVAQRPVVDVEHPAPGDVVQVEAELVALVQVVVEHRGQHVVRGGDRVHVTGQVQVQRLERDDLAVAAAGRAALDPERRAHRGLPDRDRGALADVAAWPGRGRPWWWSCPRRAASG